MSEEKGLPISSGKTLPQHQAEAAAMLGEELKHPRLGATLGLVEELGELVKEVMELEIYLKPAARARLNDEVGDVLFSLFEVCNAYGISLEEAYEQKLAKMRPKLPQWLADSEGMRQMRAKLD